MPGTEGAGAARGEAMLPAQVCPWKCCTIKTPLGSRGILENEVKCTWNGKAIALG